MSAEPVVLVCLCAAWCRVCDEYRPIFDRVAAELPQARALWIDIEDEAELIGDLDVETFPTLLIAGADGVRFAGPVLPQEETLRRLVKHTLSQAEAGTRTPHGDAAFATLAERLLARGA